MMHGPINIRWSQKFVGTKKLKVAIRIQTAVVILLFKIDREIQYVSTSCAQFE